MSFPRSTRDKALVPRGGCYLCYFVRAYLDASASEARLECAVLGEVWETVTRYIHDHTQMRVPIRRRVSRRAVVRTPRRERPRACAAPAVRRVARARFARPRIPGDGTAELVHKAWDDAIWRTWSRRSKAAVRHTGLWDCGSSCGCTGFARVHEGSRKWRPL